MMGPGLAPRSFSFHRPPGFDVNSLFIPTAQVPSPPFCSSSSSSFSGPIDRSRRLAATAAAAAAAAGRRRRRRRLLARRLDLPTPDRSNDDVGR